MKTTTAGGISTAQIAELSNQYAAELNKTDLNNKLKLIRTIKCLELLQELIAETKELVGSDLIPNTRLYKLASRIK